MKIKNIYLGKGVPLFCITIMLLCIIVTVITQINPSAYSIFQFNYPIEYPWQIITYIFLHGIPQDLIPSDAAYTSFELTVGHLGFNMLLLLPFGIMVEKVIGTKKIIIIFVASWLTDLIANLIMGAVLYSSSGEKYGSAGASGLVFCFMPLGIYILYVLGKKYGFGKLFKQVLFYLLMPIAVMTLFFAFSPNAGGVTGIPSMIIHLLAIAIGVLFSYVFRKTIYTYYNEEI